MFSRLPSGTAPRAVEVAREFAAQFGGNFGASNLPVLRCHREFCDQVSEFADIARPRMGLQDNQCVSL